MIKSFGTRYVTRSTSHSIFNTKFGVSPDGPVDENSEAIHWLFKYICPTVLYLDFWTKACVDSPDLSLSGSPFKPSNDGLYG